MLARGGRGFLLPGLLFLFAIDLVPLVYSAWLSLYDWWLLRPRSIPFVGLGNYARLATDPELSAPDHQRLLRRFADFWERAAPEKAV